MTFDSKIKIKNMSYYAEFNVRHNIRVKYLRINVLKFRTLFYFSIRMLVFRALIKMFVTIVNREDPDQTTSSEAV